MKQIFKLPRGYTIEKGKKSVGCSLQLLFADHNWSVFNNSEKKNTWQKHPGCLVSLLYLSIKMHFLGVISLFKSIFFKTTSDSIRF